MKTFHILRNGKPAEIPGNELNALQEKGEEEILLDVRWYLDHGYVEAEDFTKSHSLEHVSMTESREKFYHGSPSLFEHFDLGRAGTGTGIKFGYGVYLTEVKASAVHYSRPRLHGGQEQPADGHYLYTVEIPGLTADNHLISAKPVPASIVERVEAKLGKTVPDNVKAKGKDFRKWVGAAVLDRKYYDEDKFGAEKAAAALLDSVGVLYNVWPHNQRKPDGPKNVAVFNAENIHVVKVERIEDCLEIPGPSALKHPAEEVRAMSGAKDLHVASFIKEFYPEYWEISRYPADRCAVIGKVDGKWGVFSNFYRSPLEVNGVRFGCAEELFVLMKFTDKEAVRALYGLKGQGLKMKSKPWQKACRREDWGRMIADAMKFCLNVKYKQCREFREALEESRGLHIVERHANPRTKADAWSAVLEDGFWIGPNLLGRLLMELRDTGHLEYHLPPDALACTDIIASMDQ